MLKEGNYLTGMLENIDLSNLNCSGEDETEQQINELKKQISQL